MAVDSLALASASKLAKQDQGKIVLIIATFSGAQRKSLLRFVMK